MHRQVILETIIPSTPLTGAKCKTWSLQSISWMVIIKLTATQLQHTQKNINNCYKQLLTHANDIKPNKTIAWYRKFYLPSG